MKGERSGSSRRNEGEGFLPRTRRVLVPGWRPAPGSGKRRWGPYPNWLLKEPLWSSTRYPPSAVVYTRAREDKR